MPLPLAQRLSGNGDRLTRVDVDLAPGTDVDRWVDEHRDALGPAVVVRDGASLGERFRAFLRLITRIAYGFRSTNSLIALCLLDRGSHCPLLPNRT